jgi:hypothetical protein
MSDRRAGRRLRALTVAALVATALRVPALHGQAAADWRVRYDSVKLAYDRAHAEYVRLRDSVLVRRTARLTGGGRTIAYEPGELTTSDSARLVAGLERGRADLLARFGDRGAALLDTATWFVSTADDWYFRSGRVQLYVRRRAVVPSLSLTRPIDPGRVEAFVLQAAGDGLQSVAPALQEYAAGAITLAPEPERFAEAGRLMALSWSAAGRRCATGVVAACRAVLTLAPPSARLATYFEPADARAVVTASNPPADADSVFFADRRACLEGGAPAACARIIGRVRVTDPFAGGLRGTFVTHALALGGPGALDRLVASRATDPLEALADAAGMPEDSVIASWQLRTVRELDDARGGSLPLFVSVVGWLAVALTGAAWRRA